jgi:hypothetical protein
VRTGAPPDAVRGAGTSTSDMRRSYIRVLVVWAATLAVLYALQEFFS